MKETTLNNAWKVIAPLWPLNTFIARNPLGSFEDLPFEQALKKGAHFFQNNTPSKDLETLNKHTIKWCQSFFDQGQATLSMPHKEKGFFTAFKNLAPFDRQLKNELINTLENSPEKVIEQVLKKLSIDQNEHELFLTLLLTTLPGWAGYIKYLADWNQPQNKALLTEYLAIRIALAAALWPDAKNLLTWHHNYNPNQTTQTMMQAIQKAENQYIPEFLKSIKAQATDLVQTKTTPNAQFLFCIDARSEIIRRSLEQTGPYQTFGVAGFFGLPIKIQNKPSCPVLIKPQTTVATINKNNNFISQKLSQQIKRSFYSVKYTYTTPFALAETTGIFGGLLTALKTYTPTFTARLKSIFFKAESTFNTDSLPLEDTVEYIYTTLQSIGLTDSFAPFVIICGHGASVVNNPYKSAFNCGACGGNNGKSNAEIFAILANQENVRKGLAQKGITIPESTTFIAAEHNTVTDKITIFTKDPQLTDFYNDLEIAQKISCTDRLKTLGTTNNTIQEAQARSTNWAQVQPEWGLANNASFVVGPRTLTEKLNLKGRTFLHSYDWQKDTDGKFLQGILEGPVTVAQWINHQYLFSRLAPQIYGSGDKVTHNITSKIGVMQGNTSDLLSGLPLQSLYKKWDIPFHQPIRLILVIYAPKTHIEKTLKAVPHIKQLVDNEWIKLIISEP